jgi:hypothetical protein
MTRGTLWIRLISSWARTSSRLRLLVAYQKTTWSHSMETRMMLPLFILDILLLEVDIPVGQGLASGLFRKKK